MWKHGDELERAQNAEALCMVIRSKDWQPKEGERITYVRFRSAKSENAPSQIHPPPKARVNHRDVEMGGYQRLADESNEIEDMYVVHSFLKNIG